MPVVSINDGVRLLTIDASSSIIMTDAFDLYTSFTKEFNFGTGCTKISWIQDSIAHANYRLKIFYPAGLTWNQLVITTPPATFSIGNGIFPTSEQPTRTEIRTKCEFFTATFGATSIIMQ